MSNHSLIDALVIHNEKIIDFISGRFGDRQFAQDVVQETCIRVLQRPVGEDDVRNPMAFLYTMSLRVAIDCYRKEKHLMDWVDLLNHDQPVNLPNIAKLTNTELKVAQQQREQLLLNAIQTLPDNCRGIFILTQLYHYSQHEVAAKLKISRGMVARHLAKALKLMLPIILVAEDEEQ